VHLAQQQVVFVQPGSNLLASQLQPLLWLAAGDSRTRPAHMLPEHLELSFVGPRHFLPDSLFSAKRTIRRTVFRSAPVDRAIARIFSPANHRRMIRSMSILLTSRYAILVLLENWLAHVLVQSQWGVVHDPENVGESW
jgi:hypothetical protein